MLCMIRMLIRRSQPEHESDWGNACAGVGKSTLLLQVAAMLGSGTTPSPPQPSLLLEEEHLEDEDEEEEEDGEDMRHSEHGEDDEGGGDPEEEEDEDDVVVRTALPGQAVLYVSAEESVEQASCYVDPLQKLSPLGDAVSPRNGPQYICRIVRCSPG